MSKTALRWASLALGVLLVACSADTESSGATGTLFLNLELDDGTQIDEVAYSITGGAMDPMAGVIDTSAPGATASVEVFGLPAGTYTIEMSAQSADGEVTCQGAGDFQVQVGQVTEIMVVLRCTPPERFGAVRVNGEFNICTELTKMVVAPLRTSVGSSIEVSAAAEDAQGDDFSFRWSAVGGTVADASAAETTFTCESAGEGSVMVEVSDDGFDFCASGWEVPVTCVGDDGDGEALVRIAHLAPEIPSAEDTSVDILVNGQPSGITAEFGQASGFVSLPPGEYSFGIAAAGSTDPVLSVDVTLEPGDVITVVAIRNVINAGEGEPPVAVLAFPGGTEDLEDGLGRVFVGHGADDSLLDPVGVVNAADCPPPIIDQFAFGAVAGPLDLPEITVPVGFSLRPATDDGCTVAAGPLDARVTPGVVTILVAVDEDVTDAALNPSIYALIGDASGEIPTLAPSAP